LGRVHPGAVQRPYEVSCSSTSDLLPLNGLPYFPAVFSFLLAVPLPLVLTLSPFPSLIPLRRELLFFACCKCKPPQYRTFQLPAFPAQASGLVSPGLVRSGHLLRRSRCLLLSNFPFHGGLDDGNFLSLLLDRPASSCPPFRALPVFPSSSLSASAPPFAQPPNGHGYVPPVGWCLIPDLTRLSFLFFDSAVPKCYPPSCNITLALTVPFRSPFQTFRRPITMVINTESHSGLPPPGKFLSPFSSPQLPTSWLASCLPQACSFLHPHHQLFFLYRFPPSADQACSFLFQRVRPLRYPELSPFPLLPVINLISPIASTGVF